MSYILVKSTVDVSTLTDISATDLNLNDALTQLMSGSILVVKGFEETTGNDTFVKIDKTATKPVTVITYNDPSDSSTFWQNYPIAVNVFSLYRTYVYNAANYAYGAYLQVGDIVKYRDDQGMVVASLVNKCYKDSNGQLFYQLNDSNDLYQLEQAGNGSDDSLDGTDGKPFIPVDDIYSNNNTTVVDDGIDQVRVLL